MAETIDRELNVNVTLPESALKALRKTVANNVAAGINDGFKQFEKLAQKDKKGKKDKPEDDDKALKELASTTKKNTKEVNKFSASLRALGKTVALVIAALDSLQRVLKSVEQMSTQLISQQTLFTDKNIMALMQQTGLGAVDATAMQRALDQLGITLDDIQSGYVTEAQMAEFENLRATYSQSLAEANKSSEAMFQVWQSFALQVGTLTNSLSDMFVKVLGTSGAVSRLTTALQPVLEAVEMITEALMPLMPMVLDLITSLLPALTKILAYVAGILPPLIELTQWVVDIVVDAIGLITGAFEAFFEYASKLVETLTFGLVKIPQIQGKQILNTTSTSNSSTTQYVNNYNQVNNNLFNNSYTGAN